MTTYKNGVCGCCDGMGWLSVGARSRQTCPDCKGTGERVAKTPRTSLPDSELSNDALYERWEKLDSLYTVALNSNHRWQYRVLDRWEQVEDELLARGVFTLAELGA